MEDETISELLSPLEGRILRYMWVFRVSEDKPATVRAIYNTSNVKPLSRTKVNNVLMDMVGRGLLGSQEVLGRGGIKRRFWPTYGRDELVLKLLGGEIRKLREIAEREGYELDEL